MNDDPFVLTAKVVPQQDEGNRYRRGHRGARQTGQWPQRRVLHHDLRHVDSIHHRSYLQLAMIIGQETMLNKRPKLEKIPALEATESTVLVWLDVLATRTQPRTGLSSTSSLAVESLASRVSYRFEILA